MKRHHYLKSSKTSEKKRKQKEVKYLLETGTLEGMRSAKKRTQDLIDYHWAYYSELAQQRNQNIEEIKKALISASKPDFPFSGWQRAVKYKYSLHPLSTVGSLSFVGGRFNCGMDVNVNVPHHPALYIAEDKDTALQETLGQSATNKSALNPQQLALTSSESQTILSVSGHLDKVFDLTSASNLKSLISILKLFTVSKNLEKRAFELSLDHPNIIQSNKQLLDTVLDKNWRDNPTNLEIPANSQIFGQLLFLSGIEGVLYPSKFTGKKCLALFPQNFEGGSSFIRLDGSPPHPKVPTLIDSKNWRLCDVGFNDISGEGSPVQ